MSTRATYSFETEDAGKVTFYIHYDGYEEGAATYFDAMTKNTGRGSLADKFLRANELATLTKSHLFHYDTEYRYSTNKAGIVTVSKRIDYSDKWINIFKGTIEAFIKAHLDERVNGTDYDKSMPKKAKSTTTESTAKPNASARLAAAMAAALA